MSSHLRYTTLVEYSDLTATQVNDIVQAAITNNQVYLIAEDEDINEYLRRFIKGRESKIAPEPLARFKKIVGETVPVEPPAPVDDDVPFYDSSPAKMTH